MRALSDFPALLLALSPAAALAHTTATSTSVGWVLHSAVAAGLALIAWAIGRVRARTPAPRLASAGLAAAFVALYLALVGPLEAHAGRSFTAHMAQHMVLIALAAPLLVLADLELRLLPRCLRRSPPAAAFFLHGALIWLWHAPPAFEAALHQPALHATEHLSLFGSALIFWSTLLHSGRDRHAGLGAGAFWALATVMHTGLLGALITFAPAPLYPSYREAVAGAALSPLEDQQLAGLIMWIPTGLAYLGAGLGLSAAWLRSVAAPSDEQPADRDGAKADRAA